MKGRVVALDSGLAALVVDGVVEDVLADPPADDPTPRPEALYRARVDRVAPAIGAAFLTLEHGAAGWLRAPDARPGEMRLVQVSRWADAGKAAPLTDRVILKGAFALLTPGAPGANVSRSVRGHAARERLAALGAEALAGAPPDLGLVLRTAAADADDAAVLDEIAALRADWAAVSAGGATGLVRTAPDAATRGLRDWRDPPWETVDDEPDAFERLGVWDALAAATRPRVDLPGGGWMSVEATTALVAVDVNTGDDFSKGAAQRVNLAACAALPRALRLRGFGGVVVVDFAPVRKGARQGIDAGLKRAFADDPVETSIAGWTPLGHVEIQRKRERWPTAGAARG
ncbi:MAG: ribonuclease G [Rhodobacteraceae bacterium]|nr:MAG: ribonuclease G [Paracoccaceae bacterium]